MSIVERLREKKTYKLNEDWMKGKKCPSCGYERFGSMNCAAGAGGECEAFDPNKYDLTMEDYIVSPDPLAHEAAATITALRQALLQAQDWFQQYGNGHQTKGDTDKAKRNYDRAEFCRKAYEDSQ
jgi:hypothetical protein